MDKKLEPDWKCICPKCGFGCMAEQVLKDHTAIRHNPKNS